MSALLHDAGEPRAIVGGFFGVVAFFSTFQWRWLLGAVVLLANWPLHDLRNHAVLPLPDEHATRRHGRNARHDWAVGHSSCRSMGS